MTSNVERELPVSADLDRLLINGTPMLDVRAPIEFARGAVPWAKNYPILDDVQRESVGIRYAREGQAAAEALGHKLVSGHRRLEKIEAWRRFASAHPDACLYCWRGGQRSRIAQRWLAEAGQEVPRIDGGYKSIRRRLMAVTASAARQLSIQVLGGRTGVAKTRILSSLSNAIDLEALANHRGSAFGGWPTPRTRLQHFENALGVELLRALERETTAIVFEDEGSNIGGVSIPKSIIAATSRAPLVIVEASHEARVTETVRGYIGESLNAYLDVDQDDGFERFSAHLLHSLQRIRKRLGGVLYAKIEHELQEALRKHATTGDANAHREWIGALLTVYYDPMYDYQIEQKLDRIVFKGDRREVVEWFQANKEIADGGFASAREVQTPPVRGYPI